MTVYLVISLSCSLIAYMPALVGKKETNAEKLSDLVIDFA